MQAIILAGGYGTRLYPLTIDRPKPMVEVGGKPIIEYLVEKLDGLVSEIFVVTNQKFAHLFEELVIAKNYQHITIINDGTTTNENRLGSIGDIQYVREHANISEDVIILWGDNLFEDDFQELFENFRKTWNTIGLYDVHDLNYVKQLSNPILDSEGKIVSFVEKPEKPTSSLIGTLVYVLKNSSLRYIEDVIRNGQSDRAGDFIAYLCKQEAIYGYELQGKWFDIGTLAALEEANQWMLQKAEK